MFRRDVSNFSNRASAAVCCIAKNEEKYLDEWVRYNLKLGFSKVYIYDNADTPVLQGLFDDKPYKEKVHIIHYPGSAKQLPAYNDFAQNHGYKHTWVAYIDCDEFITLVNPEPIVDLLSKYCTRGSLAISWRLCGDSAHKEYSPSPVLERFTRCESGANQHVKCIVRCEDIDFIESPHCARLKNGAQQKDVLGNITGINALNPNSTLDIIYINHYMTKSYGEFVEKRNRGRSDIPVVRDISDFEMHNVNDVEDTMARNFMNSDIDFST